MHLLKMAQQRQSFFFRTSILKKKLYKLFFFVFSVASKEDEQFRLYDGTISGKLLEKKEDKLIMVCFF